MKATDLLTSPISLNDKSAWGTLESASGKVEGKLHLPGKDTGKLIIFEPGFPGDGSTRLEKLHLSTLLNDGFAVFTVRHAGTIANGEYAATYLNCPERQAGLGLVGGQGPFNIKNWLSEPLVAMESLSASFDEIYLMGHSFGPLAVFTSYIDFCQREPEKAAKVKRIVSLAGTFFRVLSDDDPGLQQWREYMDMDGTKEKISIGDTEENVQLLKQTYNRLHSEASTIPSSVDLVFLSVWGRTASSRDELVPLHEALDFLETLRRGQWVIDTNQKADQGKGQLAHDLDRLSAEQVLELVSAPVEDLKLLFI